MKKLNCTLAALAIALLSAAPLTIHAQDTQAEPGDGLRIATGKKGKGYSKLFADIRAVCGNQVAITEVETEGGLQNLTTLAANQAELGFVQLDTLQDMKRKHWHPAGDHAPERQPAAYRRQVRGLQLLGAKAHMATHN